MKLKKERRWKVTKKEQWEIKFEKNVNKTDRVIRLFKRGVDRDKLLKIIDKLQVECDQLQREQETLY